MGSGWDIVIGFAIVAILSAAAWFFAPKGENQTVWRSSLILSFTSMWLMWAITYLAQLHPLITPRRANLRPGYL